MACSQANYTGYEGQPGAATDAPLTASPISSAYLVVSNSPEKVGLPLLDVDDKETSTLYRCAFALQYPTQLVRLFLWHLNATGEDVSFSLRGKVDQGVVGITDLKQEVAVSNNLQSSGLCLSKVQLYQTFTLPFPPLPGLLLGTTETPLWTSPSVPDGKLCGAIVQFLVSGTGVLRLRTTLNASSSPIGQWDQTPAVPEDDPPPHVRGWWPYSEALMPGGTLDVVIGGGQTRSVAVCRSGGPEHVLPAFGWQGPIFDEFGHPNIGCYGANLYYDSPVNEFWAYACKRICVCTSSQHRVTLLWSCQNRRARSASQFTNRISATRHCRAKRSCPSTLCRFVLGWR